MKLRQHKEAAGQSGLLYAEALEKNLSKRPLNVAKQI